MSEGRLTPQRRVLNRLRLTMKSDMRSSIHALDLTRELLEAHPTWGSIIFEDDVRFVPILELEPFNDAHEESIIRANFTTPSGRRLFGAVRFGDGEAVMIYIFEGGTRAICNRFFAVDRTEREIQTMIGSNEKIFPLNFEISLLDQDGKTHSGTFAPCQHRP